MPTVEKAAGAWVYIRALDRDFHVGDRADVDADLADYLVEERGDFVYVDEGDAPDDTAGYLRDEPPEVQIDEGVCPWCPPDDRYEGDGVAQHAASAHPDEWNAYKED